MPALENANALGPNTIAELDQRIAIVRANLTQLMEQAAAQSGAADEALASERIAQQTEELERLKKGVRPCGQGRLDTSRQYRSPSEADPDPSLLR